jgi:hypothetical protein
VDGIEGVGETSRHEVVDHCGCHGFNIRVDVECIVSLLDGHNHVIPCSSLHYFTVVNDILGGFVRTINVAHGGTRDDVVGRPLEACAKRLLPGRIVVLQREQVGVAVAARDSPEITPVSVAEWAPCAWFEGKQERCETLMEMSCKQNILVAS